MVASNRRSMYHDNNVDNEKKTTNIGIDINNNCKNTAISLTIAPITSVCNDDNNNDNDDEVRRINFEHDDTYDLATTPTNDNPVFDIDNDNNHNVDDDYENKEKTTEPTAIDDTKDTPALPLRSDFVTPIDGELFVQLSNKVYSF